MYFSKTTGGFYDRAINGNNIPVDAVEITQEQHASLLAGQSLGRKINGDDSGNPVLTDPPAPSLEDLKAAKLLSINAACLTEIDGGFEHDGHAFDSDERSKSNIIGTATGVTAGVPLPEGFTWRTRDNQNVPMDGPAVIALGAALLQHISAQYALSWELKAQIDAAESPQNLDSISWPTHQAA